MGDRNVGPVHTMIDKAALLALYIRADPRPREGIVTLR